MEEKTTDTNIQISIKKKLNTLIANTIEFTKKEKLDDQLRASTRIKYIINTESWEKLHTITIRLMISREFSTGIAKDELFMLYIEDPYKDIKSIIAIGNGRKDNYKPIYVSVERDTEFDKLETQYIPNLLYRKVVDMQPPIRKRTYNNRKDSRYKKSNNYGTNSHGSSYRTSPSSTCSRPTSGRPTSNGSYSRTRPSDKRQQTGYTDSNRNSNNRNRKPTTNNMPTNRFGNYSESYKRRTSDNH